MSAEFLKSPERLSPNDIFERITTAYEEHRVSMVPYPHMLYAFFRASCEEVGVGNYTDYVSTSITSGGMALADRDGNTLPFGEALTLNTEYALAFMEAVTDDNPTIMSRETQVNPVTLGKVPLWTWNRGNFRDNERFWGQEDYLRFWFLTITGTDVPPEDGESREDHWTRVAHTTEAMIAAHTDLTHDLGPVMNDRSADIGTRQAAYFEFTNRFVSVLNYMQADGQITTSPVKRIVGLIDYERSLGCRSEFQLAELLGIPTAQPARTSVGWEGSRMAEVAKELARHDARFSAPSDRIVLALAPRLHDLSGVSLQESSDVVDRILSSQRHVRQKLYDQTREAVVPAVSGGDERTRNLMVDVIAALAESISRNKQHFFTSVYIREVLGVGDKLDLTGYYRYHPEVMFEHTPHSDAVREIHDMREYSKMHQEWEQQEPLG